MRRRRWDRAEILARVDLRALMDELAGPAIGTGSSAHWRCITPDHDDTHPSVTVHTNSHGVERWRCWSGAHGGTAIDAIRTVYNVGFVEALEELARRTGMQPDSPGVRRLAPRRAAPAPTPLHPNVVRYVDTCAQLLWKPIGRTVLEHLIDDRGLDPDVLRENRVGADPGPSRLRRPSGLPRRGPGAVFPVLDHDGTVTYCQTRYLEHAEHNSKYGNPAGRLGANPRHGWTRPIGKPKEPVVLCEGLPDAYTANAAGYQAIAMLGAHNATATVIDTIAPHVGRRPVIAAFDGDQAGRTAARVSTAALQRRDIIVVDIPLPAGADLNSWVSTARSAPDLGPVARPLPTPGQPTVPAPELPGP
jgi:DNA primase